MQLETELRASSRLENSEMIEAIAFFAELQEKLDAAPFLNSRENPVALQKENGAVSYTLEQYTFFPLHIMDMLKLAKKAAKRAGWEPVVAEIDRNIGQERGSDSNGKAHYKILVDAVRDEFGMEIKNAQIGPATKEFIESMKVELQNANPHYCLGVAYELESSAVPELTVVLDFVKRLAGDRELQPTTKAFFDMHMNSWEPSHQNELRTTVEPFISTAEEQAAFKAGFDRALEIMRNWWNALAEEARNAVN